MATDFNKNNWLGMAGALNLTAAILYTINRNSNAGEHVAVLVFLWFNVALTAYKMVMDRM